MDKPQDQHVEFVPNLVQYEGLAQKPYEKRESQTTQTIFAYCGQWKLLIETMQFLVNIFTELAFGERAIIVYIGAAPGLSIPIIHKLFGRWIEKWILYDPGQYAGTFCKELCELQTAQPESFEIHKSFFNDECARDIAARNLTNIVVLDDHRTDDKSRAKMTQDFHDSSRWIAIIGNILGAWVKFRLPWPENSDDYVDGISGKLVLQPWTAKESAECRLIVPSEHDMARYNLQVHEEKMFHYNMIDRWQRQCARHNIDLPGLDRGQDSQLTICACISAYKLLHDASPTVHQLKGFIMVLDGHMPRRIASFPTAHFPQMDWQVRVKQLAVKEAMKKEGALQDHKKHLPSKSQPRKRGK